MLFRIKILHIKLILHSCILCTRHCLIVYIMYLLPNIRLQKQIRYAPLQPCGWRAEGVLQIIACTWPASWSNAPQQFYKGEDYWGPSYSWVWVFHNLWHRCWGNLMYGSEYARLDPICIALFLYTSMYAVHLRNLLFQKGIHSGFPIILCWNQLNNAILNYFSFECFNRLCDGIVYMNKIFLKKNPTNAAIFYANPSLGLCKFYTNCLWSLKSHCFSDIFHYFS